MTAAIILDQTATVEEIRAAILKVQAHARKNLARNPVALATVVREQLDTLNAVAKGLGIKPENLSANMTAWSGDNTEGGDVTNVWVGGWHIAVRRCPISAGTWNGRLEMSVHPNKPEGKPDSWWCQPRSLSDVIGEDANA